MADERRSETPASDDRVRHALREYRQRRQEMQESRRAVAARTRSSVRRELAPLTSAFGKARSWTDDHSKFTYPVIVVVLIVVAGLLPFVGDVIDLPSWAQTTLSGATLSRVALFTLFALGLNVVVGFAGLLDLGYVAFWLIGSYTAAIMTGAQSYTRKIQQGASITEVQEPTWQMWMWIILVVALVMAVIAGIVLGSPTLRLRGDYLAIVTLGFGEILRITANNADPITGGPRGVRSIPHPQINVGPIHVEWGTLVDHKYYWLLLGFVVLWIIAIHMLDNSRIGRAWVAIREDEIAAASMGVPVVRMKLAAFVIGACTAGVGGVVYAEQVNFINPGTFALIQSILILSMVVIGGMGSIPGSIIGAAAIVILPEIFRELADYRFFVFGAALVIIMIFRPQGILPSKRRKAELMGGTRDEQLFEVAHAGEGG